jgi:hypothetical protein
VAKKKPRKSQPVRKEHFTIVGIQYRLTKATRSRLSREVPFAVYFKREPKNQYDPNAIAVFVAGGNFLENMHIGYLRKELAAVLAPKLDNGEAQLPAFGIVDSFNVDKGYAEVKMALLKGNLTT